MTLVLGHASSGKSLWAEREIMRFEGDRVYVATARIWDAEMQAKVDRHATRRGADWTLIEAPDDLAVACAGAKAGQSVLIDCATHWLTNRMLDEDDWETLSNEWLDVIVSSPARYVVVSNDVGGGVTPDNAMARRFQQMQGDLNQRLAARADRVVLVTAGLAQRLK